MSGPTKILASCPRSPQCLAWSHDGMLAVAVRDHIEIFIPSTKTVQPLDEDSLAGEFRAWHRIRLQINLWTYTELPRRKIAPSTHFSLGEEQSNSYVAALSWSSPRLAKHGRCVLAVLTTNLRVGIWASDGDPRLARTWSRVLVLNLVLDERFFPGRETSREGYLPEVEGKVILRTRVRNMAWCASTREEGVEGEEWEGVRERSPHVLAVSTDDHEVVFVRVDMKTLGRGKSEWSAHVLDHFTAIEDDGVQFARGAPFSLRTPLRIHGLAWSPWYSHGGNLESTFAYTTTSETCFRRVQLTVNAEGKPEVKAGPEDVLRHPADNRPHFPLLWIPRPTPDGFLYLAVTSTDSATCFEISLDDSADTRVTIADLGKRFDMVSGIAINTLPPTPRLIYSTVLTTARDPPTHLALPLSNTKSPSLPPPSYQQQIREVKALFSAEHDLAGAVTARTWGLVASPLGDLVASCFSLHPSQMVEYKIAATQEYVLAINAMESGESDGEGEGEGEKGGWVLDGRAVRNGDITAELIAYSLRRWHARTHDSTTSSSSPSPSASTSDPAETALTHLLTAFNLPRDIPSTPDSASETAPPPHTPTALRAALATNIPLAHTRLRILIHLVQHPGSVSPNPALRRQAIALFIKELRRAVPELERSSRLSRQILGVHSKALALLDGGGGAAEGEEERAEKGKEEEERGEGEGEGEKCDICEAPIEFVNLGKAFCGSGHTFARCALTLLAIQAPGVSKTCILCSVQVYDEEYLFEGDWDDAVVQGEGMDIDGGEKRLSVARMMYAACEVCVYCGGKYVS